MLTHAAHTPATDSLKCQAQAQHTRISANIPHTLKRRKRCGCITGLVPEITTDYSLQIFTAEAQRTAQSEQQLN